MDSIQDKLPENRHTDNTYLRSKTIQAEHEALHFPPLKIAAGLLIISFVLLTANLIAIYLDVSGKLDLSLGTWYFAWYFDFNGEANFPAFFSTMMLMLAAVLNFMIYLFSKRLSMENSKYWLVLSLVFAFLSIDENISFHEVIAEHLTPVLPTDLNGFIHWSWVVPYFVFIVVLAVYFFRFVLNLPKSTRNLFFISGLLFVFGAMGLELFEGYFYKIYGLDHIINKTLYCIEELFEMWGVILFIYALLDHLSTFNAKVSFRPKAAQPTLLDV